MSENISQWLAELFGHAITEAYATASSEHIWALGSPDGETAQMHERNADEQREYAHILEQLKELAMQKVGAK